MLDALLLAALLGGAACAVPGDLTPAPAKAQEERRIMPVERLVLAYYWWPQNCREHPGQGCDAGFGFKVHGLWPDGAGLTWPQFCRAPTPLPIATVRANYCMTPSPSLLQHEWAKHGTCHWPDANAYFGAAQKVAATINLPDARLLGDKFTAGDLRDAVVKANPKLPRASLFVGTDRKQWLTELRVCLDLRYRPAACPPGDYGAGDRVPVRAWR